MIYIACCGMYSASYEGNLADVAANDDWRGYFCRSGLVARADAGSRLFSFVQIPAGVGVHGVCVLRYDNEAGKGDHKHLGSREMPYQFEDIDALLVDFRADMGEWLDGHRCL